MDLFLKRINYVLRQQSGTLLKSDSYINFKYTVIPSHLGILKRIFNSSVFIDYVVDEMDETQTFATWTITKRSDRRDTKR